MSTSEETFIKTFVIRNRRDSWIRRLASPKTRAKQLHHLAHSFDRDLDHRYMFDNAHLPPPVAVQVEQLLTKWKTSTPSHLCHIIAVKSEWDGQLVPLDVVEADYSLSFGAVIILIPDRLAYYYPEHSNLSQSPVYVLFRSR